MRWPTRVVHHAAWMHTCLSAGGGMRAGSRSANAPILPSCPSVPPRPPRHRHTHPPRHRHTLPRRHRHTHPPRHRLTHPPRCRHTAHTKGGASSSFHHQLIPNSFFRLP
eukprot:364237-Chlamydomonas_euryale.AAC.3